MGLPSATSPTGSDRMVAQAPSTAPLRCIGSLRVRRLPRQAAASRRSPARVLAVQTWGQDSKALSRQRGGAPTQQLQHSEHGSAFSNGSNGSGSSSDEDQRLPLASSSASGSLGSGSYSSSDLQAPPSQQQQQQQQQQQHPGADASSSSPDTAAAAGGGQWLSTKLAVSVGIVGGLAVLALAGVLAKDQIKAFIEHFIDLVDKWGPGGYLAYMAVYTGLELLAVPAIPLTMTAGAIFGVVPGTIVVSISATAACTASFLIARYVARDRVQAYAKQHAKFAAIDRAIGKDGFRVVTLLRLSPLLPFAASNYLYGLTSVELLPYVLGSWVGMLPGTAAYVAAGTYSKALLSGEGGMDASGVQLWQVALGLGISALAVAYIGRLAKQALSDVDSSDNDS